MSSGGFGDVYQGTMRNGAQVALKCLRCYVNKGEVNQNALKHAAKELYAWSKCKHNNVVQLLGLAEFRGQITMVSPWMENGSVSRLDKSVSIDYRCTLSAQIAVGLSYIHSIGIVHGDLKGANVLLSDDGAAQLTDFGNAIPESRTLSFTGSSINSGLSIRWASPEQLQGEAIYSMQADVYSLAMTILEVISGKVPFMNIVQDMAVVAAIKARKTPARPEVISAHEDGNGLWGLLMRCWAWDPVERPVATTVSHVMTRITQGGACDSDSIHDTKQTLRCGSPNPPTPSHPEAAGVDVERMMMRQEALELKREDFNGYLASEGEKVSHIVNDISIQTLSNESIDQLPYLSTTPRRIMPPQFFTIPISSSTSHMQRRLHTLWDALIQSQTPLRPAVILH
ncbi:kinase-like protein [Ceratobasidium sp. AG-I]|nr:kinase-like protein [Ceratobasidium sp. AG-I]